MAKAKGSPKSGGRQKGTLNKDSQDLFAICEKHGVNVFEAMVMIAIECDDHNERFEKLKEIAPYLYAKRKQLDVGLDPEKNKIEIIIKRWGE